MIRLLITPTLTPRGGHAACPDGFLYDVSHEGKPIAFATSAPFLKSALALTEAGRRGEVEFCSCEDGPVQLRGIVEKMIETISPEEVTQQRKTKAPAR